jgi:prepilin peptidase CpaA
MSIVWLLFVMIGLSAAVVDVAAFRIPNLGILALCLLFVGVAVLRHAEVHWLDHLGAGALCLAAGVVLYMFWQMGAGDAKLLAALALWSGLGALIPLLLWTAVSGLALLIVILVLRRALPALQKVIPRFGKVQLPRVLLKRQGIPFGAGIVLGAIIASPSFPSWLWQI